jgi:hypothetical protein
MVGPLTLPARDGDDSTVINGFCTSRFAEICAERMGAIKPKSKIVRLRFMDETPEFFIERSVYLAAAIC